MSSTPPDGRRGSGRFLPFLEARAFVRGLNFQVPKDFRAWCRSGQRPANVPSNPDVYYPEFVSWPDWLGTAPRPYEEAIAFVHPLGIATREDWFTRHAAGEFPRDIPKNPNNMYKGSFTTWADFLGRKKDFRFRPFAAARQFIRALSLKNKRDHTAFVQSDDCPKDIPSAPEMTYKGKGWVNYADYLGLDGGRLDRVEVLAILGSLREVVRDLTRTEMYAVLNRRGLAGHRFATNSSGPILRGLEQICHVGDPAGFLNDLIEQVKQASQDELSEGSEDQAGKEPFGSGTDPDGAGDEAPNDGLMGGHGAGSGSDASAGCGPIDPPVEPSPSPSHFRGVDWVAEHLVRRDEDLLSFLVDNRLDLLWQEAFQSNLENALALLGDGCGGVHYAEIGRRFREEFDAVENLPVPSGYTFQSGGQPSPPNRMQKLTALRVLRDRRVGNWSGVGTGKTVAAILAAIVVEAKLTIVVAFNSTLDKWGEVIRNAYPAARVLIKERGPFQLDPGVPTFLIFNYEWFQQDRADAVILGELVSAHKIDFIVLDEIHSARQRRERPDGKESARHRRIKLLVAGAGAANPGLRVLAMSATPVVNNLYEARMTLELLLGKDLGEVPTRPRVQNAIEYHKLFRRHGIRQRVDHGEKLGEPQIVEVDGMAYLRELLALKRYGYIPPLERVLLKAKLAEIVRHARPGTLIYTHYVTEMVDPLERALVEQGLSVGLYTGEEKSGLQGFLDRLKPGAAGTKDVLIGSAPIGTGVDGLQFVCDRLIFACLPWTRAEYDQVVGRLTRLNGTNTKVDVIIPEVVLRRGGEEWSWERRRRRCIEYKRTIADAALDGVIPDGRLPTPDELYRQSMESLAAWEAELTTDGDPEGADDR